MAAGGEALEGIDPIVPQDEPARGPGRRRCMALSSMHGLSTLPMTASDMPALFEALHNGPTSVVVLSGRKFSETTSGGQIYMQSMRLSFERGRAQRARSARPLGVRPAFTLATSEEVRPVQRSKTQAKRPGMAKKGEPGALGEVGPTPIFPRAFGKPIFADGITVSKQKRYQALLQSLTAGSTSQSQTRRMMFPERQQSVNVPFTLRMVNLSGRRPQAEVAEMGAVMCALAGGQRRFLTPAPSRAVVVTRAEAALYGARAPTLGRLGTRGIPGARGIGGRLPPPSRQDQPAGEEALVPVEDEEEEAQLEALEEQEGGEVAKLKLPELQEFMALLPSRRPAAGATAARLARITAAAEPPRRVNLFRARRKPTVQPLVRNAKFTT